MVEKIHVDHVSVKVIDEPARGQHPVELSSAALLLDVLLTGAELCKVELLPPGTEPWDKLENVDRHGHLVVLPDLQETLDAFLRDDGHTHEFAIRLLRIFRVNTRWAIASKEDLTPREILALVNLKPEDYTLYPPGSDKLLPLDTPVRVHRGERFEAQRDGKYGEV
jgi:hypothetical protein